MWNTQYLFYKLHMKSAWVSLLNDSQKCVTDIFFDAVGGLERFHTRQLSEISVLIFLAVRRGRSICSNISTSLFFGEFVLRWIFLAIVCCRMWSKGVVADRQNEVAFRPIISKCAFMSKVSWSIILQSFEYDKGIRRHVIFLKILLHVQSNCVWRFIVNKIKGDRHRLSIQVLSEQSSWAQYWIWTPHSMSTSSAVIRSCTIEVEV